MTRALIDQYRGRRSLAALSRAIGERDEWLSRVLTHTSPPRGKLPDIEQINRLACELDVPAARLLLSLASDSGLADAAVTSESIALGSAFRSLNAERQKLAAALMEALAKL